MTRLIIVYSINSTIFPLWLQPVTERLKSNMQEKNNKGSIRERGRKRSCRRKDKYRSSQTQKTISQHLTTYTRSCCYCLTNQVNEVWQWNILVSLNYPTDNLEWVIECFYTYLHLSVSCIYIDSQLVSWKRVEME